MLKNTKRGYTLIEILIVISIIGFVAAAAMYSLNNARMKSRDTKRFADIKVITKALELYYDKYGIYPYRNGWSTNLSTENPPNRLVDSLQPLIDEDFLNKIPDDPLWPNNVYPQGYWYGTENLISPCPSVNNNLGYVILLFTELIHENIGYPIWSESYPNTFCITP